MRTAVDAQQLAPARATCETYTDAWWCEFLCRSQMGAWPLGAQYVHSPRLALRWARTRAEEIAQQIAPQTCSAISAWLADEHEHERALRQLVLGQDYSAAFHAAEARYVLVEGSSPVLCEEPAAYVLSIRLLDPVATLTQWAEDLR